MKGNIGEWSEFYAFIHILNNNKVEVVDATLAPILGRTFNFEKIYRKEPQSQTYDIAKHIDDIHVTGDGINFTYQKAEIASRISRIFDAIKTQNGGGTTFEVAAAEEVAAALKITKLSSASNQKADLEADILNWQTGGTDRSLFSIKSLVGAKPTLINASQKTNFIYSLDTSDSNLDQEQISKKVSYINSLSGKSKYRDRVSEIYNNGMRLVFKEVNSNVYQKNLMKIDTMLPEFLSSMIIDYFRNSRPELNVLGNKNEVLRLSNLLEKSEINSKYGLKSSDFEYKIKNFLVAAALGMVPSIAWSSDLEMHGGIIIVRKSGDLGAFHIFDRSKFLNYLFSNTVFDTPSASKFKFGELYPEGDEYLFKLNAQIRFK